MILYFDDSLIWWFFKKSTFDRLYIKNKALKTKEIKILLVNRYNNRNNIN